MKSWGALGMVAVIVFSTVSCGDDEDKVMKPVVLTEPSGVYEVAWNPPSSNCLFDALLGTASTYNCRIQMTNPNAIRVEQSPLCMGLPLKYDQASRKCEMFDFSVPGSFDVPVDEESLVFFCETAKDLFGSMANVDCSMLEAGNVDITISNVKVTSDLTWAEDYKSFQGEMGMSADIEVVVRTTILGFEVEIPLMSEGCSVTMTQAGTRCSGCSPDC